MLNNGPEPNSTRPIRAAKFSRGTKKVALFVTVRRRLVGGGGVIGCEIVLSPVRHSDTGQRVTTFRTGRKVTQTFAQLPLSDLNIWGRGREDHRLPRPPHRVVIFMKW